MISTTQKSYNFALTECEAAYIWHLLNFSAATVTKMLGDYEDSSGRGKQLEAVLALLAGKTDLWAQWDLTLRRQGFNPRDFLASPVIRIDGHPVIITKDSIKVGCTTVPRDTVLEIASRLKEQQ